MRTFLISIFFSFLFFLNSVQLIFAQELPQVIFINHVRGTECCDPGNLNNFLYQVEQFQQSNLPAFFALRYDALTDPSFISQLQKLKNNSLFQFGIMLEITPKLAYDSLVEYKDEDNNWYKAQNAFTIGYSVEERKLLIDRIVETYFKVFQKYPGFSTAWQTDSFSLNYLKEEYQLKVHQIAREQWGLDSYTLSGGPIFYPYPASNSWFFIPDYTNTNPVTIIRHTVDDPLYSYGDTTSSFTSQPNDYAIDHKNFSYFKDLINQALFQPSNPGFANLGLENSMSYEYQKEYAQQILYISQLKKENKISLPDLDKLINFWQKEKISLLQGSDLIHSSSAKAYWITTPNYRIRLRFEDENVFISDLRVYNSQFSDPYQNKVALSNGFLIVPYLINDSLSYPAKIEPTFGQRLLGIIPINSVKITPKQDLTNQNNKLILPSKKINSEPITSRSEEQVSIKYQDANDQLVELLFDLNNFSISNLNQVEINQLDILNNPIKKTHKELSWQIDDQVLISSPWQCKDNTCTFSFNSNPDLLDQARETQYPFLFPEEKPRQADSKKTIIYAHNKYAIANRNPIRIIIAPHDENGFPVTLAQQPEISTNPTVSYQKIKTNPQSESLLYLDLDNDRPQKTNISINLGNIEKKLTVIFAPNCKSDLKYCLLHPRQAFWYVKTIFNDKLRVKLLKEQQ